MAIDKLKKKITDDATGGVFFVSPAIARAEIAQLTKKAGWLYFHLDCSKITTKSGLLKAIGPAMHFPDYYGENWDAFEECLTDLSWAEGKGTVLLLEHVDGIAKNTDAWETFCEILEDSCDYWAGEDQPLLVVMTGEHLPKGVARL